MPAPTSFMLQSVLNDVTSMNATEVLNTANVLVGNVKSHWTIQALSIVVGVGALILHCRKKPKPPLHVSSSGVNLSVVTAVESSSNIQSKHQSNNSPLSPAEPENPAIVNSRPHTKFARTKVKSDGPSQYQ